MTDFELFRTARARLETVWREADRRTQWLSQLELGKDPEIEASREAGSRV
jgi:hypothetical protein